MPSDLLVSADTSGKAQGGYSGNITLKAPGAANSPLKIPVLLTVGASVTGMIGGKVLTSDGRGLRNATISLTDSLGVVRTATTSAFGFYSFDNVLTGGTYTLRVSSRQFRFSTQAVHVSGNLAALDFVGLE